MPAPFAFAEIYAGLLACSLAGRPAPDKRQNNCSREQAENNSQRSKRADLEVVRS